MFRQASRTNRLALLLSFIAALGFGAAVAVFTRQAVTGQSQPDPCFGTGKLISSRQVTVDDGSVKEFRDCSAKPAEHYTVDAETGKVVSYNSFQTELEEYYKEHPEEIPFTVTAKTAAAEEAATYVTPVVPDVATITSGCDPAWKTEDYPGTGLRVCYPSDWQKSEWAGPEPALTNGKSGLLVYPGGTYNAIEALTTSYHCLEPLIISTPKGTAGICAKDPSLPPQPESPPGQDYTAALPVNRIAVFSIGRGDENARDTVLRILLSIEDLP